eukprot:6184846-Pleurochrysis_carterae.AAC.1
MLEEATTLHRCRSLCDLPYLLAADSSRWLPLCPRFAGTHAPTSIRSQPSSNLSASPGENRSKDNLSAIPHAPACPYSGPSSRYTPAVTNLVLASLALPHRLAMQPTLACLALNLTYLLAFPPERHRKRALESCAAPRCGCAERVRRGMVAAPSP